MAYFLVGTSSKTDVLGTTWGRGGSVVGSAPPPARIPLVGGVRRGRGSVKVPPPRRWARSAVHVAPAVRTTRRGEELIVGGIDLHHPAILVPHLVVLDLLTRVAVAPHGNHRPARGAGGDARVDRIGDASHTLHQPRSVIWINQHHEVRVRPFVLAHPRPVLSYD